MPLASFSTKCYFLSDLIVVNILVVITIKIFCVQIAGKMIEDSALKLSNENGQGNTNRRQILYKRRWFILFVVSLVNFTGNMV